MKNNPICIYLPATTSIKELTTMLTAVEQLNIDTPTVSIGRPFDRWLDALEPNTEAYVYSCAPFSSVSELLAVCQRLTERKIILRSIREPWLNDPQRSAQELMTELFKLGALLHSAHTRAGLERAAAQGRRPGRAKGYRKTYTSADFIDVDRVDELCAAEGLSTVEACRRLKLSVYSYYHRRSLRRRRGSE